MNTPGFTADYSLAATSSTQLFHWWMDISTTIYPAALPIRCGPCNRDPDYPDTCEQTCCRVDRINDEPGDCWTRPCECPPCGACERDGRSPTGASITCCYPTATPFHPAGCITRPCKAPDPVELGPECRGVFCDVGDVCTYDGCCRPNDVWGATYSPPDQYCEYCRCRNPRINPPCPPNRPIRCGDVCCSERFPHCLNFGGRWRCVI